MIQDLIIDILILFAPLHMHAILNTIAFARDVRVNCAFTPKANCAAKTVWSLIKNRC